MTEQEQCRHADMDQMVLEYIINVLPPCSSTLSIALPPSWTLPLSQTPQTRDHLLSPGLRSYNVVFDYSSHHPGSASDHGSDVFNSHNAFKPGLCITPSSTTRLDDSIAHLSGALNDHHSIFIQSLCPFTSCLLASHFDFPKTEV